MRNISKHITYKEATKSRTAEAKGISNEPSSEELKAMENIAENIFEPLRAALGGNPLAITSFYRGKELNKVIGGSSRSQHCKGEAMDIDADVYNKVTNKQVFEYIRANLEFDQLIWEFGNDSNPSWVHVSLKNKNNRGMVLRAARTNGKTNYTLI